MREEKSGDFSEREFGRLSKRGRGNWGRQMGEWGYMRNGKNANFAEVIFRVFAHPSLVA
jgi:hypothetical protein